VADEIDAVIAEMTLWVEGGDGRRPLYIDDEQLSDAMIGWVRRLKAAHVPPDQPDIVGRMPAPLERSTAIAATSALLKRVDRPPDGF
jgi:hypothetical protein